MFTFLCAYGDCGTVFARPQRQKGKYMTPTISFLNFFGLVSKSPTHTGLICAKTPEPNLSCLGSFNKNKNFQPGEHFSFFAYLHFIQCKNYFLFDTMHIEL
jgi:hypothetical protein